MNTMAKAAIVILAGNESHADYLALANGLEAAKEFAENDDDELELIFDGAGTQWIPELEDEESDYHELYQAVRDDAAVCDFCSGAFGVDRRGRRRRTGHPRRVRRAPEHPLARRRRLRDHHVLSGRRLL